MLFETVHNPLSPTDGGRCRPEEGRTDDVALKQSRKDVQGRETEKSKRSPDPPVPGGWEGVHETFRDNPQGLQMFISEATRLVQGHISRATYNVCLGLLAGRLMLW